MPSRLSDSERADQTAARVHRETLQLMKMRMEMLAAQPGRNIENLRTLRIQQQALEWALQQTERDTP